mgnify:CR=1 FL=1
MENQFPGKPKVNYWMISTLILGILFLVMLFVNLSNFGMVGKDGIITPPPPEPPTPPVSSKGTVKTGTQLGEAKSHCADGLYLVTDEGKELIDGTGTTMLLLRLPGDADESSMLADQQYVGKQVEVVGKYPASEVFCQALTCGCEDSILVDQITIVDEQSRGVNQTTIVGQIVCLPPKNKTGSQTLECAYGIQNKDNKYYGLGFNPQDEISGKIEIILGREVAITGMLTLGQDSQYDSLGTIEVVSVEYTD